MAGVGATARLLRRDPHKPHRGLKGASGDDRVLLLAQMCCSTDTRNVCHTPGSRAQPGLPVSSGVCCVPPAHGGSKHKLLPFASFCKTFTISGRSEAPDLAIRNRLFASPTELFVFSPRTENWKVLCQQQPLPHLGVSCFASQHW